MKKKKYKNAWLCVRRRAWRSCCVRGSRAKQTDPKQMLAPCPAQGGSDGEGTQLPALGLSAGALPPMPGSGPRSCSPTDSGQETPVKTEPEESVSICTHGLLLLRVQLEVTAKPILLLGTLPWARPVWARRFDVLKMEKKKPKTKRTSYLCQSCAIIAPLPRVRIEGSGGLTGTMTAQRLSNSLLRQWLLPTCPEMGEKAENKKALRKSNG